ncbi:sorbosone dehydrogenase family protein [Devosia sp. ZB163]|uniref:PQQ-dependent sugar dehydrogenase n=1 Tax=Devosia sp. ZB163 TaxID=3025938 RepID=UPI002360D3EC|nr:sorbosone dehydrogenase family protein [Devosia sp. ZB163]MDC9822796.1 sorbosone dehydrogenase family protein [Devosia sp. ZB163]
MTFADLYARLVAWIGAGAILARQFNEPKRSPIYGGTPDIPEARPQSIPTLKMPTARGWSGDNTPVAAAGLKVNAFAKGLNHPRWMHVLPNGDVLVAEALSVPGGIKNAFDYAMYTTMRRAAAVGESPNRIILLRDADGDGVAETRHILLEGLNQPFGMQLIGETLYVGNTDGVYAYPFKPGETRITAPGKKLMDTKPGGHWTRSLLASADKTKLYVGVGSLSNIAEHGFEAEEGRACIYELDLTTGKHRIFAGGLRNPVGLAFEPTTNVLYTVVNERDGIGDETPPDYLTSVKDGGFYGWPYSYWGKIVDDRVPQDPAKVASATAPDFALGGHTASLGLCWLPEGTLPGFPDGMAIGQHGSWNRSTLSGYKLAFVPFSGGKPTGTPREILTGFLSPDEKDSYGRPVGVVIGPDGSVLLADDVGDVIWRVTGA